MRRIRIYIYDNIIDESGPGGPTSNGVEWNFWFFGYLINNGIQFSAVSEAYRYRVLRTENMFVRDSDVVSIVCFLF